MLQNLFRPRPEARIAHALYAEVASQARRPAFYTALGVPDRIDARFELYTLHVALLTERLRAEGERGTEVGQKLFDEFVSALDAALRELGVGDLAVARKMRTLGEALYGRMRAYGAAMAEGEEADMADALARNVYGEEDADAAALAAYVAASRTSLAAQPYDALAAAPAWAALPAGPGGES